MLGIFRQTLITNAMTSLHVLGSLYLGSLFAQFGVAGLVAALIFLTIVQTIKQCQNLEIISKGKKLYCLRKFILDLGLRLNIFNSIQEVTNEM
jgi:hypothetical protein